MFELTKEGARRSAIKAIIQKYPEIRTDIEDINKQIQRAAGQGNFGLSIPVIPGIEDQYYDFLQRYFETFGFLCVKENYLITIKWN